MYFFTKKKRSPFKKIILPLRSSLRKVGELIHKWTSRVRRQTMLSRMRKADIILASPRTPRLSPVAFLYRIFLKSRYIHSMLYIGGGKIIHTTSKEGVVVSPAPQKIYKKNRYILLRVKNLDEKKREQIVAEALKWKGTQLDLTGMLGNIPRRMLNLPQRAQALKEKDRVWCSQLLYKSFLKGGVELIPQQKSPHITSEDLAHSPVLKRI
ncbi:hypothetical protein KGY73_08580 [bacterium]|nr:hypothetical protein [bacterium]